LFSCRALAPRVGEPFLVAELYPLAGYRVFPTKALSFLQPAQTAAGLDTVVERIDRLASSLLCFSFRLLAFLCAPSELRRLQLK
jgi:hypothetical protein